MINNLLKITARNRVTCRLDAFVTWILGGHNGGSK